MPVKTIIADGSTISRNPSRDGVSWAYRWLDEQGALLREESDVLPVSAFGAPVVGNNTAELLALVEALAELPNGWGGIVMTDSQNTLGRFFDSWATHNVPEWLRVRMRETRNRLSIGRCTPVLLDGHPTEAHLARGTGKKGNPCSIHNVVCDRLAGEEGLAWLAARDALCGEPRRNGTLRERYFDRIALESLPPRAFRHLQRRVLDEATRDGALEITQSEDDRTGSWFLRWRIKSALAGDR